jgi:hypothetical protein
MDGVFVASTEGERVVYSVPKECVFRLAASPLERVWRNAVSGSVISVPYSNLPPDVTVGPPRSVVPEVRGPVERGLAWGRSACVCVVCVRWATCVWGVRGIGCVSFLFRGLASVCDVRCMCVRCVRVHYMCVRGGGVLKRCAASCVCDVYVHCEFVCGCVWVWVCVCVGGGSVCVRGAVAWTVGVYRPPHLFMTCVMSWWGWGPGQGQLPGHLLRRHVLRGHGADHGGAR